MVKSDSRRKFLINTATLGEGMMLPVKTLASLSHIQVQEDPDFIIVGSGAGGGPLAARLAHKLNGNLMDKGRGVLNEEIWPPKKNPETGLPFTSEELRSFVTQESWGHHASCTCKMGPTPEKRDVVNSKFQVHGVDGLRIVDASVFPNIPGLFIAALIYTIAEKAADELTKKYKR